jgi:hypothetical protein
MIRCTSQSISLDADAVTKINGIQSIAASIIAAGYPDADTRQELWASWFYTYLMWHESAALTTRTQSGGGPGRGLMQFEATTAWDLANIYVVKNAARVASLADAAGVDSAAMQSALQAFADAGDPSNVWPPDGDQSKIEGWLLNSDTFGVTLMQLQFHRYSVDFPPIAPTTTAADPQSADTLGQHADTWADNWWKGPASQRPGRISAFLSSARALNTALGG